MGHFGKCGTSVRRGEITAQKAVTANGFSPCFDKGIVIEVDEHKGVNVVLPVAGTSEEIIVTDAPTRTAG